MSDKQLAFQALNAYTLNGKAARLTGRSLTYQRKELICKDGTDRTVLTANQFNELITKRAGNWVTRDQMWRVS